MRATGIVRKVDNLGRIVIPSEVRKIHGINDDVPLEIFIDGESIILKKYEPCCTFCGEARNVTIFKGKLICHKCETEIKGK